LKNKVVSRRACERILPWLLVTAAGLVMYLRAPNFFHQPRIWAEEGLVYMSFAL